MKYVATNEIRGLKPPSKGPNGEPVEHIVKAGEIVELDEKSAAPLVEGGSLVPKGKTAE